MTKAWVWFAALIAVVAPALGATELTDGQRAIMKAMARDDLIAYSQGGEALLAPFWSGIFAGPTSDVGLAQEFVRDPVGADAKYSGKLTFVDFRYMDAERWFDDTFRVQGQMAVAYVSRSDAAFLANAKRTAIVKMACSVEGKELGTVRLRNCVSQDAIIDLAASRFTGKKPVPMSDKLWSTLVAAAKVFDSALAKDDPCRAYLSGACVDQVKTQLARQELDTPKTNPP